MDFDDHEDQEEEMGLPVGSSYDSPPPNSSRGGGAAAAAKIGGIGGGGGDSGGNRKPGIGGGAKYRECLKNHAVSIGGHAVDGCGEFMAAGEDGTLDALKCAACNCHRNFHRKDAEFGAAAAAAGIVGMGLDSSAVTAGGGYLHHHHHQFSPYYRTPAGYLHPHHHAAAAAAAAAHGRPSAVLPLALPSTSGGGGGTHSRDDGDDMSDPMAGGSGGGGGVSSSGKKRFRTKFTPEQKEKMLAFADRLGWRIQKHDEAAVQQFCAETTVKRHVLKVWMHNNKHTLGKKP